MATRGNSEARKLVRLEHMVHQLTQTCTAVKHKLAVERSKNSRARMAAKARFKKASIAHKRRLAAVERGHARKVSRMQKSHDLAVAKLTASIKKKDASIALRDKKINEFK